MRLAVPVLMGCLLLAGCGQAPAPAAAVASQPSAQTRSVPEPKGAVLLVHGHDGSANDWDTILPWLKSEGWSPKAFTFATEDWNIGDMADQVGMQVEALCRQSGQAQIEVLAHSIGGIATRHYIKNSGGDKRIRRLVTLGSPHHGIRATHFLRHLRVAPFLYPGGDFLKALNAGDETPGTTTYTSIWSTGDYTQWSPYASGRLKGAHNYRTGQTSHAGMLTDTKLFPTIREGLTRPLGGPVGPEQKI